MPTDIADVQTVAADVQAVAADVEGIDISGCFARREDTVAIVSTCRRKQKMLIRVRPWPNMPNLRAVFIPCLDIHALRFGLRRSRVNLEWRYG